MASKVGSHIRNATPDDTCHIIHRIASRNDVIKIYHAGHKSVDECAGVTLRRCMGANDLPMFFSYLRIDFWLFGLKGINKKINIF